MKRHPLTFCLGALALLSLLPATAAESPAAPMLRIEAGMHTGAVHGMAFNGAGTLGMTFAHDKTARLWGFPGGQLLRVLRPPTGTGDEGKLYAGDLSPDGRLAAVGGLTVVEWDGSHSVYLFDTATGQLARKLDGLPDVVLGLMFSPSGRFLAAVGRDLGLRIWDVATGKVLGRADVSNIGLNVEWYGEDRLVTTCLNDNTIRLFRFSGGPPGSQKHKITLLKERTVKGGKEISTAKFSPDGSQIAIGFSDSTTITVLDGKDLSFAFAPDVSGVSNGALNNLAWSPNGAMLAAGGTWEIDGKFTVRTWSNAGRGKPGDVAASTSPIAGLQYSPEGELLFVDSNLVLGIVNQLDTGAKKPLLVTLSSQPNWKNTFGSFRVSPDGTEVSFRWDANAPDSGVFSVRNRSLKSCAADAEVLGALSPPRMKGMGVTGWCSVGTSRDITSALAQGIVPADLGPVGGKPLPKLAGRPLQMVQISETSHSLAIDSKATSFLLGTGIYLRNFNSRGTERWKVETPDIAYVVNLADNDQLAIAAFGDGTIRWYSHDNGQELLALFPSLDQKRWVLWAPLVEKTKSTYVDLEKFADEMDDWMRGFKSPQTLWINGVKIRDDDELEKSLWTILPKSKPGDSIDFEIQDGKTKRTRRFLLQAMVVWMPTAAYYDCSPGAEELIGWHVNRDKDREADFFPASKFRDQFYRPDIIQHVLQTRDVAKALAAANEAAGRRPVAAASAADVVAKQAPPVVSILDGGVNTTVELNGPTVSVRYTVRSPASPATRMTFKLNGRPIEVQASVPPDDSTPATATFPTPEQDAILSVLAENRYAVSEPATLRLMRSAGGDPAPSATSRPTDVPIVLKPKLYVLAVGVSDYSSASGLRDLGLAAKDAKDFAATFQTQEGLLYQKVETLVLTDETATASAVRKGLDWVLQQTTSRDVCAILLAGHGENDNRGRYFFCPHDYDTKSRLDSSVSYETIRDTMSSVPGKVLFFVDTCHAGNALGKMQTRGVAEQDLNRLANELSSAENGAVVFCSSTGQQLSQEKADWGNGAFTKAVVEGLSGKADLLGNGKITIATLEAYVAERVKELTDGAQSPTVAKPDTLPDFPIAAKR